MGDRLTGKVALVVGAGASGPGMSIGRAAAMQYAEEGRYARLKQSSSN